MIDRARIIAQVRHRGAAVPCRETFSSRLVFGTKTELNGGSSHLRSSWKGLLFVEPDGGQILVDVVARADLPAFHI